MPAMNADTLRARFRREGIDADSLGPDPMAAFRTWHADWMSIKPFDPVAAVMATADAAGRPSVRLMDMVGVDDQGFVFVTHGDSRKAREVAGNPQMALCYSWLEIGRQVTVSGIVGPLPDAEADQAFLALPRDIRLVAATTYQSAVIDSRDQLVQPLAETRNRLEGQEVARPASWVGYRVIPLEMEFCQSRPEHLQDRVVFLRDDPDSTWTMRRLSP